MSLPPDEVEQTVKDYLSAEIIDLRQRLGLDRAAPATLGPRPDRTELAASMLLHRQVPPRDFLLQDMLSTTSRWLINGETGVGKTLFGLDLAFAVAGGANFLNWKGGRVARVAYFDGELPFDTLKERLEASEKVFGVGPVTVYNRDILEQTGEEMPPFNTEEGQAWLWREMEGGRFALAIFDNVMTLTGGAMNEEEAWRPMIPMIRRISSIRTAQIWLHHTGHDPSRGYGTKTREWNMDTVAHLQKPEGEPDSEEIKLEFRKARLRKPETAYLFAPVTLRRTKTGWIASAAHENGQLAVGQRKRIWLLEALDELARDTDVTRGHAGEPVQKVALPFIREQMRKRGHLESDDNGKIPASERKAFQRAREDLIASNTITTDGTMIWRVT